jgi:hypothetical protein
MTSSQFRALRKQVFDAQNRLRLGEQEDRETGLVTIIGSKAEQSYHASALSRWVQHENQTSPLLYG